MSNFQKRKYFMKNGSKFRHSEHYGLGRKKKYYNFGMTKIKYFRRKKLKLNFYCYNKQ
uniref:Uncharacterized protein n=1 Tax=viral metagenome TaxID=1070528 RepID=A0A6C0K102_9ZZZZ